MRTGLSSDLGNEPGTQSTYHVTFAVLSCQHKGHKDLEETAKEDCFVCLPSSCPWFVSLKLHHSFTWETWALVGISKKCCLLQEVTWSINYEGLSCIPRAHMKETFRVLVISVLGR